MTRGGRVFRIWKLRTMVLDAEPGGVAVWPEEHDPRITRLGRVLRRLWIDELPQLWNVLRGDMSVVGPRPERPEFVEAFAEAMPKYQDRHAVPAGITGLAQVHGLTGNTSIRTETGPGPLVRQVLDPGPRPLDPRAHRGPGAPTGRGGQDPARAERRAASSGVGGGEPGLRVGARQSSERHQDA